MRNLPLGSSWGTLAPLLVLAFAGCAHKVDAVSARTVVWSAKSIRTQDPASPSVEALVVRDGKVVFTGPRAAAVAFAGADAEVEDFADATIVPGLVDAHAHLASLGRSLSVVSLNQARSADEAIDLVAANPTPQGDWIVGRGWDQNDWPSKQFPTREALDAKFPNTPVYLVRVDGHAAWVNGAALQRAGITRATKDPAGGRILRDASTGEPSGVVVDNAMDAVVAKIPAATDEQIRARLNAAMQKCVSVGLTGMHDAGMEWAVFMQLQHLDATTSLPLRIYAMADGQGTDSADYLAGGPFEGRKLRLRAVKFLADGALGSRGAALHAPYADEPSQSGLLLLKPDELKTRAQAYADKGFQVAIHAIGDKANTAVLDVLSELEAAKPGRRHRVEHAQILKADDVPRFAKAHVLASFQPTHATSDMPWAGARVGEERLTFAYAWRSVLDTGAHVAFGSDFPVEEPDPLAGLYAARFRMDAKGAPAGGWHPEQKVTGEEALAAFTTGSAYAEFAEGRRGVLKEGMDADFVVLSVDPVTAEAPALLQAKVLATVVAGDAVYRGKR